MLALSQRRCWLHDVNDIASGLLLICCSCVTSGMLCWWNAEVVAAVHLLDVVDERQNVSCGAARLHIPQRLSSGWWK